MPLRWPSQAIAWGAVAATIAPCWLLHCRLRSWSRPPGRQRRLSSRRQPLRPARPLAFPQCRFSLASDLLMSPGFSESMRKLHEPCGARLVDRRGARTPACRVETHLDTCSVFDTVCESCGRTGRREESRRGTQECVRYVGDHLPHSGSSSSARLRRLSSTSGGL